MSATGTGAEAFVHGVGFYRSDEEFLRAFAPFCRTGLESDEATVVRVVDRNADLLRDVLGEPEGLTFLPWGAEYTDPPAALAGALSTIRDHVGTDGASMRLLGELPPMTGLSRDAWLRYEAAANHVLRDLPVFAVCPFDSRTLSPQLQEDLLRVHHVVLAEDGARPNPRYEVPAAFAAAGLPEVRDPIEDAAPDLELADPTPAAVRTGLARLADDMHLEDGATHALLVAASEVVTNALLHGVRPVVVRGWGRPGRVVVAVRDRGSGPTDPLAGMVPARTGLREGGRGLWITHQVCPEVALSRAEDGFTVRLAAGPADGACSS